VGGSADAVLQATATVAEQLTGLMQRKAFLRESAACSLVELLQDMQQGQVAAVLAQAPKTAALLAGEPSQATPESMLLALRLWHVLPPEQLARSRLLPSLRAGQAPPPALFWQQPLSVKRKQVDAAAAAVFDARHVQVMADALLLSTGSHPRLHPVWGCLLALLMPGFVPLKVRLGLMARVCSWRALALGCAAPPRDHAARPCSRCGRGCRLAHTSVPQEQQQAAQQAAQHKRSPPDQQQLQALWQHFVVERCLSSSHERKALALQLLLLVLPVATAESVPVLLHKQLLGCIASALKDKTSYLHARAERCMVRSCEGACGAAGCSCVCGGGGGRWH
jgi:DNA polymerase phi